MDYKGLEKTFNIKIPVVKHAEYYIETLKKSPQFENIATHIELFKDYENMLIGNGLKVKDDKMRTINKIIESLKTVGFVDALNGWSYTNSEFSKLGYTPEEDQLYLSVDIKEANWTVAKYFLNYDLPKWELYLKTLGYHDALATSKSFRQYVLGNTNPKRFASMQKLMTEIHLKMLSKTLRDQVVMISEDEIIFKISNDIKPIDILNQDWKVPVKGKMFRTNYFLNCGDHIRVDTIFDNSFVGETHRELKAVNGNRFFLHFKTLILNEEIDDRDLLFLNDKNLAKWVV